MNGRKDARKRKTGITILLLFLATQMYATPCGIHRSADRKSREYILNPFKNRSQAARAINPRITLAKLAKGSRYENTEAAAIIGYVARKIWRIDAPFRGGWRGGEVAFIR